MFSGCRQTGISYIEVMLATAILAVSLVPALQAVQSGIQSASVHESLATRHFSLVSRRQELHAESFASLVSAADAAGGSNIPTSYSDSAGSNDRVLVFLAAYDADNADSDGDVFTVVDPNTDGDNNPYTSADTDSPLSLLWMRIAIENGADELTTLVRR